VGRGETFLASSFRRGCRERARPTTPRDTAGWRRMSWRGP